MKKKIQKPFNVEAAKNGAVIETKSGYPVRVLCYNRVGSLYPIIALVKQNGVETCYTYTIEGHQFKNEYDCKDNLVIVDEVEEPEFKVDDYIVSPDGVIFQVLEVDGTFAYKVLQLEINLIINIPQDSVIGVYHKWTIADAKPGDILVYASNSPFIYKGVTGADYHYPGPGYPIAYCGITTSGDFKIVDCDEHWTVDSVKPATLEQCNRLFKKMDDMGYLWDSESLTVTPKRWRDNKKADVNGYFIDRNSHIESYSGYNISTDRNVFATKKQAKSALAMARISQIMANDERFGGPVTDENWGGRGYYTIIRVNNSLLVDLRILYNFLSFHTEEQAKLFLKENEDLVKDYYMMY